MMLKTTPYYRSRVQRGRPEIKDEWVEAVIQNPLERRQQDNGWWQLWGPVPGAEESMLRVITREDLETAENAFLDRNFAKRRKRK
jgi:hypothetical protein